MSSQISLIEKYRYLDSLPGLLSIKDNQSKYVAITREVGKIIGWKGSEDAFGKSDHDLPCAAANFAENFINLDKKVLLSGKKLTTLDIHAYHLGWQSVLGERLPLYSEDEQIIGTFAQCINVTHLKHFRAYLTLHQMDSNIFGKALQSMCYILDYDHSHFVLTIKQENCLFLLLRGKTIKEIAKILKLSPRTVENHMDGIKIKLGCKNKSDMIEKAIDAGFLGYIPKFLQCSILEKIIV
jgi:DNA-binding CsgD family transcriptional regulator